MIEKQKSFADLTRAVAGGEYGIQPLEALMEAHGLSNSDVVAAIPGLVTHKMLNKARRGRRLSRKVQLKVQEAFNSAAVEKEADRELSYGFDALFNYDGR